MNGAEEHIIITIDYDSTAETDDLEGYVLTVEQAKPNCDNCYDQPGNPDVCEQCDSLSNGTNDDIEEE
jgi:hypothetical protein